MKRVVLLLLVLLSVSLFAVSKVPAVEGLKIANQEECKTSGECDFTFQIIGKKGPWKQNRIYRQAMKMRAYGEFVFNIAIETGDDVFKGSLYECIYYGICNVERDYITFTNIYSEGGWYDVVVTFEKNRPNNYVITSDNVHHSILLHKPICMYHGTRSEGWYWEDIVGEDRYEAFIQYARCGGATEPTCDKIGSKSEGWYAEEWEDNNGQPMNHIVWDQCHQTAGYALNGEKCGAELGLKCYGDNLQCIDGTCQVEEPVCLTYEVAGDPETAFYAINFKRYGDAKSRLFGLVDEEGNKIYINEDVVYGSCREYAEANPFVLTVYAPVCGTPIQEESKTFGHVQHFRNYIMKKAGDSDESKGKYVVGECEEEKFCVTYETVDDDGRPLQNFYAINVASYEDGKGLLDSISNRINDDIEEGSCSDQIIMCPLPASSVMPVCGDIDGKKATYDNSCFFKLDVRKTADKQVEAKGSWEKGACENKCYADEYIADPEKCMVILYTCDEGYEPFSNEKGCGCRMEVDCTL